MAELNNAAQKMNSMITNNLAPRYPEPRYDFPAQGPAPVPTIPGISLPSRPSVVPPDTNNRTNDLLTALQGHDLIVFTKIQVNSDGGFKVFNRQSNAPQQHPGHEFLFLIIPPGDVTDASSHRNKSLNALNKALVGDAPNNVVSNNSFSDRISLGLIHGFAFCSLPFPFLNNNSVEIVTLDLYLLPDRQTLVGVANPSTSAASNWTSPTGIFHGDSFESTHHKVNIDEPPTARVFGEIVLKSIRATNDTLVKLNAIHDTCNQALDNLHSEILNAKQNGMITTQQRQLWETESQRYGITLQALKDQLHKLLRIAREQNQMMQRLTTESSPDKEFRFLATESQRQELQRRALHTRIDGHQQKINDLLAYIATTLEQERRVSGILRSLAEDEQLTAARARAEVQSMQNTWLTVGGLILGFDQSVPGLLGKPGVFIVLAVIAIRTILGSHSLRTMRDQSGESGNWMRSNIASLFKRVKSLTKRL